MPVNLNVLVIHVIVNIIIIAPVLWMAGRVLTSREKAKFTDSLMIVVLGTVIGSLLQFAFSGIAASLIVLILWLALIKHFFDCGWLKAFLIAVVAVVIFVVVGAVLALLGFFAFRTLFGFP